MFVKKDLRKIPEILDQAKKAAEPPTVAGGGGGRSGEEEDGGGALTELRLARRPAEFGGSLSVLCRPSNLPALRRLVRLSLYDCRIESLDGIGALGAACPDLRELNVGRNPLTSLPDELSALSDSLTTLWCDDCAVAGPVPDCVLRLRNLEVLRMSGNAISSVPADMEKLTALRVLCLDGNRIKEVPAEVSRLERLESLILRQNRIERLPEGVPGRDMRSLTLLHVSSNGLVSLPDSLSECRSLEAVYANGNRIKAVPDGVGSRLAKLRILNLSTNGLESLPADFVCRFGEPDAKTGVCEKDETCKVQIDQNPVVERARALQKSGGENNPDSRGPAPMDVSA